MQSLDVILLAFTGLEMGPLWRNSVRAISFPIKRSTTHLHQRRKLLKLVCLYNGKSGEALACLRYRRYCQNVATNISQVQPQNLPPTSAAATYHGLRVYFQVQQWKGVDETNPSALGYLRDDCLYFKSATSVLIKTR